MSRETRLRRIHLLLLAFAVGVVLLVGRLVQLQVIHGAELEEQARRQRIRPVITPAPRGQIFDRSGRLLVGNRPAFVASLVYTGETMDSETQALLAELLDLDLEEVEQAVAQLNREPFWPVRLKVDLTPEEHTRLEEARHRLPGVIVETLPIRWYPYGEVMAHVLGHVQAGDAWSVTGAAGIEASFNGPVERDGQSFPGLTGTPGQQVVEVDALFRPHRVMLEEDPVPGHDVVLTLDARLQAAAEEALRESMESLRASRGSPCPCPAPAGAVVVQEVSTGAILAMASQPAFDPNVYTLRPFLPPGSQRRQELDEWLASYQTDQDPAWNRAIQARYPPGSVFKLVTALAGLENDLGSLSLYCSGSFTYGRRTVRDWRPHGSVGLAEAIGESCNVYFWTVGTRVGVEAMGAAAGQVGLDGPSVMQDLPEAVAPRFPHEGDALNVAIGQGEHLYSPLHVAGMVATLASGAQMRPYVVERVVDGDGNAVYEARPEVLGVLNMPQEQLEQIRAGMRATTGFLRGRSGTAYGSFRDAPYVAAGKTGTVERQGRPSSHNHGWFAGYAPAGPGEKPEIAVAVIVEGGGGGARAAAPVARHIMDVYFGLRPSPLDQAETPVSESGEI